MYSIYQIFQSEQLVYSTYHTMNNQYSDKTKLDIILTAPTTPLTLCTGYYLEPHLYSIKLYQQGISNALEATEIISKLDTDTSISKDNSSTVKAIKTRKPRVKKVVKKDED